MLVEGVSMPLGLAFFIALSSLGLCKMVHVWENYGERVRQMGRMGRIYRTLLIQQPFLVL